MFGNIWRRYRRLERETTGNSVGWFTTTHSQRNPHNIVKSSLLFRLPCAKRLPLRTTTTSSEEAQKLPSVALPPNPPSSHMWCPAKKHVFLCTSSMQRETNSMKYDEKPWQLRNILGSTYDSKYNTISWRQLWSPSEDGLASWSCLGCAEEG